MNIFAHVNPWLVAAAALFVGFVLGRMSVRETSASLRRRDAEARSAQARMTGLDAAAEAEIRQIISSGQKISAIKRYRELSGCSLKEAKAFVETLTDR